jgi:DNA-binding XRE family transcriptional regulator
MIKDHSSPHIAAVRVLLGITQQQLANSLGVSRSLVAMAETNRRALPATALPLLKGMKQIAATIPEPVYTRGSSRTAHRYNRVRHSARTNRFREVMVGTGNSTTKWQQPSMAAYNQPEPPHYNYSTALLKDRHNCQELLNNLLIQKAFGQQQLQYLCLERETAGTRSLELAGKLERVNALWQAGQQLVSQYPQSPAMKKWLLRNAEYHYKKLLLEHKMENFTAVALLQRELRINIMEKRLVETERVIDTVSRRMEMVE